MQEQLEIEGLGNARLELVGRYVEAASGLPPRTPLRFWIGGEWVELSEPEPQPPEAARPPAAATAEAVDPWSAVRARDLPVYRWVLERVTDDAHDGTGPGRPRSLALASGSGRPIGRRPVP
jgi:hypothetical protein